MDAPYWPLCSPTFRLFPGAHSHLAHHITIVILIFITILFISLSCTCGMCRGSQACCTHSSNLEVFLILLFYLFLDMKRFQMPFQQGLPLWFKPQLLVPQQIPKKICPLLHFDVTNLQSEQLQRLLYMHKYWSSLNPGNTWQQPSFRSSTAQLGDASPTFWWPLCRHLHQFTIHCS